MKTKTTSKQKPSPKAKDVIAVTDKIEILPPSEGSVNQPALSPQKETSLIEWESLEFNNYSRNWVYYLLLCLALVLVVAFSIYRRDWFVIVIAIILSGFLVWYQRLKPKNSHYKITQLGFYVNSLFYPYSEIHSFWLLVNNKDNKLNLIFNKKYLPQLSVLLADVDPLQLKAILGKHIPERENHTESIVDKFMRFLKL